MLGESKSQKNLRDGSGETVVYGNIKKWLQNGSQNTILLHLKDCGAMFYYFTILGSLSDILGNPIYPKQKPSLRDGSGGTVV